LIFTYGIALAVTNLLKVQVLSDRGLVEAARKVSSEQEQEKISCGVEAADVP